MKYVDEFRNVRLIRRAAEEIKNLMPAGEIRIMEVCGTHTQNFFRFGLDELLPPDLKLISGPGCPVCVSAQNYIDQAIRYSRLENTIIATFGDMLRVPGTVSSLEQERARGSDVRMVYSPLDALEFARRNKKMKIIFLAVGFETTAPTVALSIMQAEKEKLNNLFFFSSLKLIPAAIRHLLKGERLNLSGFLCPGHVSAIIGSGAYGFIPAKFKIGCCVTGFEPLDILEGIYLLLKQIVRKKPFVANQYMRVVRKQGNPVAEKIIARVFHPAQAEWRGLGLIPASGLKIRDRFSKFDAEIVLPVKSGIKSINKKLNLCRCGEVLKGLISPVECKLFGKSCDPQHPLGPCMISLEGSCNAYYKYKRKR